MEYCKLELERRISEALLQDDRVTAVQIMNSQERREARYQRRQAKRQERRQARCAALGPLPVVFSYRDMFRYGKRCCNGVRCMGHYAEDAAAMTVDQEYRLTLMELGLLEDNERR